MALIAQTREAFTAPRRAALFCCACFLLLQTAAAPAGTWPTYHGGYTLDGYSDTPLPDAPVLLWSFRAGSPIGNAPVADDARIYVATEAGDVIALDRNGAKVWSRRFTETGASSHAPTQTVTFTAPLMLAGGRVIAAGSAGRVYALEPGDGRPVWTFDTRSTIRGSPSFATPPEAGSRLVVLTQPNGALFGLDPATGRPVWTNTGTARADGHLAASGPTLALGSCAAGIHAVAAADGRQTGFIATTEGHEIAGGIAIRGDAAFAGTRGGHLVAASLETGRVLWRFAAGDGELFSTPAVGGDRVVFATPNGDIACVHRADGAKAWVYAATAAEAPSPVIARNRVAAVLDGTLHLLDLADGKAVWSVKVADSCGSPALVDGMILVGAGDGVLRAFGAKAGTSR